MLAVLAGMGINKTTVLDTLRCVLAAIRDTPFLQAADSTCSDFDCFSGAVRHPLHCRQEHRNILSGKFAIQLFPLRYCLALHTHNSTGKWEGGKGSQICSLHPLLAAAGPNEVPSPRLPGWAAHSAMLLTGSSPILKAAERCCARLHAPPCVVASQSIADCVSCGRAGGTRR